MTKYRIEIYNEETEIWNRTDNEAYGNSRTEALDFYRDHILETTDIEPENAVINDDTLEIHGTYKTKNRDNEEIEEEFTEYYRIETTYDRISHLDGDITLAYWNWLDPNRKLKKYRIKKL